MSGRVLLALAIGLVGIACRPRTADVPLLRVVSEHSVHGLTLSLVAAPGIRINARVKPALELPDGTVLRFDSPRQTPDSAYFTSPPTAVLPARLSHPQGTLRASVCQADELVCRSVMLRL